MPNPTLRRRRVAATTLSALLLLTALVPLPVNGAGSPWARQKDDPIAVAKRQRDAIHGRIETQSERLARLRASTKALSTRMDRTANKLDDLTASIADVEAEVADAKAALADTQSQHDDLAKQVGLLDWSLDQLTDQADELAADLQDRRRQLGQRLADAYRTGQTPMWQQVIGASSFMDVVVAQDGLVDFAQHDQQLALGIERDQTALDVRRRDLRRLRWETDQLRASVAATAEQLAADRDRLLISEQHLADRHAATDALRAEQEAQFHELAQTKDQVAAAIVEQQRQAARVTARLRGLVQKELHSGRLPSAFNNTLRWPLKGRVSQEFGCTGFPLEPAYGDCAHFHRGIDIVSAYGSPVAAAGDGVVLFVGYDPEEKKSKASWSVVIGHSTKLITVYGHLIPDAPNGIVEGATVRAGQTIGYMGNTGNSTGAHLHWGVWLDGDPVNPRYFL